MQNEQLNQKSKSYNFISIIFLELHNINAQVEASKWKFNKENITSFDSTDIDLDSENTSSHAFPNSKNFIKEINEISINEFGKTEENSILEEEKNIFECQSIIKENIEDNTIEVFKTMFKNE